MDGLPYHQESQRKELGNDGCLDSYRRFPWLDLVDRRSHHGHYQRQSYRILIQQKPHRDCSLV